MLVEVFTFDACPHASGALDLTQTVAAEIGGAEVRLVHLSESEAYAARFLGSPSIRVDGRDVEPGADSRRDYAFSCRLYSTARGLSPLPDERWLRDALNATTGANAKPLDEDAAATSVDGKEPGCLGGNGERIGHLSTLNRRCPSSASTSAAGRQPERYWLTPIPPPIRGIRVENCSVCENPPRSARRSR